MNYTPRIALVDDQPEFLDLFRRAFGDVYSISGFTSWEEAQPAIKEGDFDAVILDILMPEKSGLDILKEIKDSHNIPVLMVTASKKRDNIISALRLGADDYLEKPFEFDLVQKRIDEALKKRLLPLPDELPAAIEMAPDLSIDLDPLDHRVKMVLAVVQKDYAAPVTLHHLSKMLNLAPYYLGRLVKQETGYSFKEILARHRMRRAADILVQSQHKIKDVAHVCGFSNFHYFCRMFHRYYGHPASRHRKLGR